jgi:hypothetical protein
MSRVAPRVHTQTAQIARMEALALQLPQDVQVEVALDDGTRIRGLISATPSVQVFYDPEGREGLNALLRLDAFLDDGRPHPDGVHDLWLDTIAEVMRVPNPSPPEPSTRPPDPNAPAAR